MIISLQRSLISSMGSDLQVQSSVREYLEHQLFWLPFLSVFRPTPDSLIVAASVVT